MNAPICKAIVSAGVAGMLVVACGGGNESATTTIVDDGSGVVVRALDGLRWENPTYTADAGDVRLVLENTSSQPHNLAIIDAQSAELPVTLDTPSRSDVDEATIALDPGSYALICKIPGHGTMNSTLTVE